MKSFLFIVFAFLSFTFHHCQKNNSLVGTYSSPESNTINKLQYGSRALGLELELKSDSTFVYTTCAQITNGSWNYQDKKLILNCEEKKMKIDSLNQLEKYAKGKICGEPEVFQVKNNKLSNTEKFKNGKTVKSILVKND